MNIQRIRPRLFTAMTLAFLVACARPDTSTVGTGLQMFSGASKWSEELSKLKNPFGILPNGTNISSTNITFRDPATNYEFFAFDDTTCLLLLSNNPVYFMRLETKDFQYHLKNELKQINDGLSGAAKAINSTTYYKDLGDYQVEVYFVPNEAAFTQSGTNQNRISDANSTTYVDLWRLAEAANNVVFYTPSFDDQKIADDFSTHAQSGKNRLILTDASTITSPQNYNLKSYGLNFSFMLGNKLDVTANLLGCTSLDNCSDKYYYDQYWLPADFAAFFSVPIGNSADIAKDYLSGQTGHAGKDGIMVVVRGNITKFQDFLSAQGVNLAETPVVPYTVSSASAGSATTLDVVFGAAPNSAQAQVAGNYCIALAAAADCSSPALSVSGAVLSGSTVTLTTAAQTVGTAYRVYVTNVTRASDGKPLSTNTADFNGYKPAAGIKITEVFIDDSPDAIEFRITSPGYIDGMKLYISGSLVYTFPNSNAFSTGDMIVFHAQAAGTNETTGNASLSSDTGFTAGYDFWQSGSAITSTDAEAEIQSSGSVTLDYVAWSDGGLGSGQDTRVFNKTPTYWTIAGGSVVASDLVDSTLDDGTGLCLQRINSGAGTAHTDTNSKSDWISGTCGLGTNQNTSPPAFNVTASTATAATTITVTFSGTPNATQSQTSTNYCIALTAAGNCSSPALTISNAALAGSTVTLTTSSQTGGTNYTVYVTGVTSSLGIALTTSTANFTGYTASAVLVINEVAAAETSSKDLIELYVVTGGNLSGLEVFEGSASLKVLPTVTVAAGDYIVIHINATGTDETTAKTQSADAGNLSGAWDFWSSDSGLTATDNAIILKNAGGTILDACIFGNNSGTWTGPTISTQIDPIISAGQWTKAGGSFVESDAVMPAAGGMAVGQSAKRSPNAADTNNSKADWVVTAGLTIGSANP